MWHACANMVRSIRAGVVNVFGKKSEVYVDFKGDPKAIRRHESLMAAYRSLCPSDIASEITPLSENDMQMGYIFAGTYKTYFKQSLVAARLRNIKTITEIGLLTDELCFLIDPYSSPYYLRKIASSYLLRRFYSLTMFDLYDAIEGKVIFYSNLFSKSSSSFTSAHSTSTLLIASSKPDAICTLCAKVESPGFYTGCLLNDGEDVPRCEYTCDGNGNLFLKRRQ